MKDIVLTTLDCGCAILDNGKRVWCPSCSTTPQPPSAFHAIHVTGHGGWLHVRIEYKPGKWAEIICTPFNSMLSEIVEPLGIEAAIRNAKN